MYWIDELLDTLPVYLTCKAVMNYDPLPQAFYSIPQISFSRPWSIVLFATQLSEMLFRLFVCFYTTMGGKRLSDLSRHQKPLCGSISCFQCLCVCLSYHVTNLFPQQVGQRGPSRPRMPAPAPVMKNPPARGERKENIVRLGSYG